MAKKKKKKEQLFLNECSNHPQKQSKLKSTCLPGSDHLAHCFPTSSKSYRDTTASLTHDGSLSVTSVLLTHITLCQQPYQQWIQGQDNLDDTVRHTNIGTNGE